MSGIKTILGAASVIALSALSMTTANAAQKIRMLLDWTFQGPQSLFTYALDKGYFAAEGLDVTVDGGSGSTDAVVKLASGVYDIAFGDINSMMEFNVKHPTQKPMIAVMMIYDRAPLCVVSLDPDIKTPKDLEGKKMVSSLGAADLRLFPVFAHNAGIDPAKISFTYVTPNLREPLLIKHQADASTAFYHTSYMSLKAIGADVSKLRVFRYADYGVELYGNAVMTSRVFAEQKPDTIKAFDRALARAIRDVVRTPEAAIPTIKRRDGTTNEAVELERLRIVNEQSIATPYVRANGFGDIDRARMEKAIDQITQALELPTRPNVDDSFTSAYLPPPADRRLD